MDSAVAIGELFYMDHNLRWGGLLRFYGVLYVVIFAPLAYGFARHFRKPWPWVAFALFPVAVVSETAVGYYFFLEKCESQTAIEQVKPVPESFSVAYREERKAKPTYIEVVRYAILERDGTVVATVKSFVFRSGILAQAIAGESAAFSEVPHLSIICMRHYPSDFMDFTQRVGLNMESAYAD